MLYDTVKFQNDPAFSPLKSASYTQEGGGTAYVERNRRAVAGAAVGGAFNTIFVETVAPNAGDTYLLGGQVLGGTGSFIVPDIKIIDNESGVLRANGTRMTLKVTGTGVAADGVLLAGFTATAADIIYTTPTSVTVPTAGSLSGKFCFIDLGVFTTTGFQPTSAGHVNVSFCPSSYNITRF